MTTHDAYGEPTPRYRHPSSTSAATPSHPAFEQKLTEIAKRICRLAEPHVGEECADMIAEEVSGDIRKRFSLHLLDRRAEEIVQRIDEVLKEIDAAAVGLNGVEEDGGGVEGLTKMFEGIMKF